jgi:hypothetical protein
MYYLISFIVLLLAEMFSALHSLCVLKNYKHGVALFSALGTACWCIKVVVVINQPLTIVTAFIGAYVGTLIAFWINKIFLSNESK